MENKDYEILKIGTYLIHKKTGGLRQILSVFDNRSEILLFDFYSGRPLIWTSAHTLKSHYIATQEQVELGLIYDIRNDSIIQEAIRELIQE
jgi:hypothetical protein